MSDRQHNKRTAAARAPLSVSPFPSSKVEIQNNSGGTICRILPKVWMEDPGGWFGKAGPDQPDMQVPWFDLIAETSGVSTMSWSPGGGAFLPAFQITGTAGIADRIYTIPPFLFYPTADHSKLELTETTDVYLNATISE